MHNCIIFHACSTWAVQGRSQKFLRGRRLWKAHDNYDARGVYFGYSPLPYCYIGVNNDVKCLKCPSVEVPSPFLRRICGRIVFVESLYQQKPRLSLANELLTCRRRAIERFRSRFQYLYRYLNLSFSQSDVSYLSDEPIKLFKNRKR